MSQLSGKDPWLDRYPPTSRMRRADGSRRFAYCTFMVLNDSYVAGAVVLAFTLRSTGSDADIICLVNDQISEPAYNQLSTVFDKVIKVETVFVRHKRRQQRQDWPYLFTRFHSLRLGPDGGLGCSYERVVMLDADMLALRNPDHLFSLPPPAGIINESKEMLIETEASGEFRVADDVLRTGRWRWHDVYEPICPHGQPIPKAITDRVRVDMNNMGIQGSLMVIRPDADELQNILDDIKRPEILDLVGDKFNWPDMQYATMRWSGNWTSVDARFSGISGYPSLDVLFFTHYAGFKPWYFRREGSMKRWARHPDFQLWFKRFLEMLKAYSQLAEHAKFSRMRETVTGLRGGW